MNLEHIDNPDEYVLNNPGFYTYTLKYSNGNRKIKSIMKLLNINRKIYNDSTMEFKQLYDYGFRIETLYSGYVGYYETDTF